MVQTKKEVKNSTNLRLSVLQDDAKSEKMFDLFTFLASQVDSAVRSVNLDFKRCLSHFQFSMQIRRILYLCFEICLKLHLYLPWAFKFLHDYQSKTNNQSQMKLSFNITHWINLKGYLSKSVYLICLVTHQPTGRQDHTFEMKMQLFFLVSKPCRAELDGTFNRLPFLQTPRVLSS